MHEIWDASIHFRETISLMPSSIMNSYFHLKIELFCKGRSIFNPQRTEYLLHRAVFENNLPLISRLIKCTHEGVFYAEKNEIDSCGNTPLILAVKLGYVDAIKVLCDLFTCPKMKSFNNCNFICIYLDIFILVPCALEIASAFKNKEVIKILLEAN